MTSGNGSPVRVGIAGLGRSGWNIHAKTFLKMTDQYRVVAVADADDARLAEAQKAFDCRAYKDFDELIADDAVDLLVVASPNLYHVEHSITAMRGGKHVVCEKPIALSTAEADEAIGVSRETGRVLAPFQNRRYEPHFLKVLEVLESGVLGRIIQIRMCWHGFSRRWDWQTLQEFGGGLLNNNGAHLLDQAMVLFGDHEPEPFVDLQQALTSGDTEDHVKVILRAPGAPTIDIELTSASAYASERWHVMGTAGGLHGTMEKLDWKWVDWSSMPDRPVDRFPTADRAYNREDLEWKTRSWVKPEDYPGEYVMFYKDLYKTLRHGAALYITPASVRRHIALQEKCRHASLV